MNKLKEKLKKNGGFTMVELLIVVAIIGILAAVSIPLFNNALEKARHGVDAANNRSAISLANAEAIASLNPAKEFENAKVFYYITDETGDHQGALVSTLPSGNEGIKPKCVEGGIAETNKQPLMVKIEYNTANASTDPLSVFTITTSWTINETTGHVTATEAKADFEK